MKEYDAIIIGAGCAGMSASQYLSRAGYSTLLLDGMGYGGQLMFIDEVENYPGVEKISGYELSEIMEKQCQAFGVDMEYEEVIRIEKINSAFILTTNSSTYKAKAVIAATGAEHKKLKVEGEEKYKGCGVSYCATCDGPFFRGKKVAVVGGGDSAITDALFLSKIAKEVTIIHRRDSFKAQKALVDKAQEKDNITFMLEKNVKAIVGDGEKVTSLMLSNGESIECDGVFIFVGISPRSKLFSSIETKDGFIVTDENMRTSLPGLFAVGDVRYKSFRQIVTATSDGAIASKSIDSYLRKLRDA